MNSGHRASSGDRSISLSPLGAFDATHFYIEVDSLEKLQRYLASGSASNLDCTLFHEMVHAWQSYCTVTGLVRSTVPAVQAQYVSRILKGNSEAIYKPLLSTQYGKFTKISSEETYDAFTIDFDERSSDHHCRSAFNRFQEIEHFAAYLEDPQGSIRAANSFLKNTGATIGRSMYLAPEVRVGVLRYLTEFSRFAEEVCNRSLFDIKNVSDLIEESHGSAPFSTIDADETPLGLLALQECQARIFEVQLAAAMDNSLCNVSTLKANRQLSGIYYAAFRRFAKAAALDEPDMIHDWRFVLFCVACDVATSSIIPFFGTVRSPDQMLSNTHPWRRMLRIGDAVRANKGLVSLAKQAISDFGWSDPRGKFRIRVAIEQSLADGVLPISEMHANLTAACVGANHPQMYSFYYSLERFFAACRIQSENADEHLDPLVLVLERHAAVPLLLPNLFIDKAGEFALTPFQFGQWQRDGLDFLVHLVFHFGSQIYTDLVRQLVLRDGPFTNAYSWLPAQLSKDSMETANFLFEKHFNRNVGRVVISSDHPYKEHS